MYMRSSFGWRLFAVTLLAWATAALHGMSVIPPTFDQLVGASTTVVRGVVSDVHCASVETSQGTAIQTLVTVRVERVLKGTADANVTLTFLGGKLGARTLKVVGMPTFNVGDREIVFFSNNGRAICPLIAAGYGRYHVRHDSAANRDYVTRDNGLPLVSTDDIVQSLATTSRAAAAGPGQAMTPEAFEDRIIAAARGNQTLSQP